MTSLSLPFCVHFDTVPVSGGGGGAASVSCAQHGDAHRPRGFHSVTASCLLIVAGVGGNVLIKSSFLLFQETYHMNIK